MNNGHKSKVLIQIELSEDGEIHFTSTSKNLVTIFGMLETAKLIATQPKEMESPILRPAYEPPK